MTILEGLIISIGCLIICFFLLPRSGMPIMTKEGAVFCRKYSEEMLKVCNSNEPVIIEENGETIILATSATDKEKFVFKPKIRRC